MVERELTPKQELALGIIAAWPILLCEVAWIMGW